MISISSFKKVVNNYDYFLFDQWGVLHNGSSKFPQAEECLSFLKKKDKRVILVSNSSRPTKFSINNLDKLVKMNVRLKNELNVDSRSYWKNTHKALGKISERLVKLANKVGQLK